MNTQNQNEILDFGEDPVTTVEAKLAILSFGYNWADMVELEERSKGDGDVPGPQEHLSQTNLWSTTESTVEAAGSSTAELADSKGESKSLCDPKSNGTLDHKDAAVTNLGPTRRDSDLSQLGEKDNLDDETSSASPEKTDEAYRIDNSVIQSMKRLVQICDAESGIVVGEIHAQYFPRVSNEEKSPLIGTSAIQASRTESGATMPKVSQSSDHQTNLLDGNTASCFTQVEQNGTGCTKDRTMKIRGLETIDTEISILSTEILEPQVQESKSERDAENEYFTNHPLMRLFLCGACCCSKKGKGRNTEKRGLWQRIRKFFHRN